MNDSENSLVAVCACACHDSHGTAVDKDGTVTETYKTARCAAHRDKLSIYRALQPDVDFCTIEERAVIEAALVWREIFKWADERPLSEITTRGLECYEAHRELNRACDSVLVVRKE